MILPDAETLAFIDGYHAFEAGCPREEAPMVRREAWLRGWEQAEEDATKAADKFSPNAQDKALCAWDDDGGADDYEHEFDFDDD